MSINKLLQKIDIKIIPMIFIIFLISLNSKTILLEKISLINIINFVRLWTPLLFIIFFIKKFNMLYFKDNLTLNLIILAYICQFIGLINLNFFQTDLVEIINENKKLIESGYIINNTFSIIGLILPICLLLYFTIFINNKHFNLKTLNYILIIFLILVGIISIIKTYYEYLNSDKDIFFYTLDYLYFGKFLETQPIRSTGLSRIFLILSIFSLSYFFLGKKIILKKIFFILYILSGTAIFLLQSRISIYFYILTTLIFFLNKEKIFFKITKFFLIYILINFLSFMVINSKNYITDYNKILDKNIINGNNIDNKTKKLKTLKTTEILENSRIVKSEKYDFYSGRINIWKKIVTNSTTKNTIFFFGLGPFSDRYVAYENASSAIFYQLISSGIIGLTILIILYIRIVFTIINTLINFLKKKNKIHYLEFFGLLTLSFILIRSLVENSFTSYNIDLFLLIISYLNIKNYNSKFFK